ncbi:MAG TPA: hypothetical protein VIK54_19385 [Acidimicrobiia bacterium]
MAGNRRDERRGVSLTRASLILIGVAVLWAGGAAGFGIGYKFEQGHTKSAVKSAKTKSKGKTKATAAQLRLQKERTCLAGQGLHWPKITGKFGTQVKTPPPGVTEATYQKALIACYAASAAKTNRAPPTTTGAAAGVG